MTIGDPIMNEPKYDPAPALELIKKIEADLEQLRGLVQPQLAGPDPKDPRNKYPDLKLTPRGVEICYQLFDRGASCYRVSKALDISHGAAKYRQGRWREAGGVSREKFELD